MPYLNSSWNFLSENVYFWYGRAKISQVKLSWSSRGAKFSKSGDVTLRVASSKHMAVRQIVNLKLRITGEFRSAKKKNIFSPTLYGFRDDAPQNMFTCCFLEFWHWFVLRGCGPYCEYLDRGKWAGVIQQVGWGWAVNAYKTGYERGNSDL